MTKTLEQFASTPNPGTGKYPTDAECDTYEKQLESRKTALLAPISLQELCDHAELGPETYSGRGMMGRQCLGVQCDNTVSFVTSVLCAAREMCSTHEQLELTIEGIEDALGNSRTDSMGRNMIIYFPGVLFESGDSDEDE